MITEEVASFGPPLDRAGAMELTSRLRGTWDGIWRLVAEAYFRSAWSALGYESFVDYLRGEIGMSKTEGYRLLEKAGVVAQIVGVAAPGLPVADRMVVENAVAAEIPVRRASAARKELPAVKRTAKRVAKRAVAAGASPAVAAADGARAAIANLPTFKAPAAPGDDEDRARRAAEYAARTGRPAQPLIQHCATCTCGAR